MYNIKKFNFMMPFCNTEKYNDIIHSVLNNNYMYFINNIDKCNIQSHYPLFILACCVNYNTNIIEYFIDYKNVDVHNVDGAGNNIFLYACKYNPHLNTIKYIVDVLHVNTLLTNYNGDTGFTLACWKNRNIKVIDYLINELNMDTYHKDQFGCNAFVVACWGNTVDVIKYIVENIDVDIYSKSTSEKNGLMLACEHNNDVSVVKYLIEELGFNKYAKINLLFLVYKSQRLVSDDNNKIEIVKYLTSFETIHLPYEYEKTNIMPLLERKKDPTSIVLLHHNDITPQLVNLFFFNKMMIGITFIDQCDCKRTDLPIEKLAKHNKNMLENTIHDNLLDQLHIKEYFDKNIINCILSYTHTLLS